MDTIGTGAQYKVLDTHDGRVRKLPLTHEESVAVVKSWYPDGQPPLEEIEADYHGQALRACTRIKTLLSYYPELGASLGNPLFEGKGAYTQDKVSLLREVMHVSSPGEAKRLLDDFRELIIYHWRYGFSDSIFNFTINNGLDEAGAIVLLDFGEITFDKEKVRHNILSKRWLRSYSYMKDIPEELKQYYRENMEEGLTVSVLNENWGKALKS